MLEGEAIDLDGNRIQKLCSQLLGALTDHVSSVWEYNYKVPVIKLFPHAESCRTCNA